MKQIRIKYCQPCGFMPRAMELAGALLEAYGMKYNKELSVSLEPGDRGIFEVMYGEEVLFSKEREGRYPEAAEIIAKIK